MGKRVDKGTTQADNMGMNEVWRDILSDPVISRIFGSGVEAFLVGGFVRDMVRGVRSRDIDFVVKADPRGMVSRIFPEGSGSVIAFRETLLVRVVAGDTTVDFSELRTDIESDLLRRDFTVNAIGWSPERGLIDPLNGMGDIATGRIRGISEKNFADDPLRLLRAYRLSAELGWTIDGRTRGIIRKLRQSLKTSATERITLELHKLLNAEGCSTAVRQAFGDGLLGEVISLGSRDLSKNIKALSRLNSFLKKIPEGWRGNLDRTFSQGLSYSGLLRAEQLLYGADIHGTRISPSKAVLKRLEVTTKLLDAYGEGRKPTDPDIFDLFAKAGEAVVDFSLLTGKMRLLRKAERYLQMPPLLAAGEVMEMTGLVPGPELGRVLYEMKKLQFLGKLRDGKDARKWLSHGKES